MTQKQYLQRMANLCGALSGSAGDAELINWARGKGLSPSGGWDLSAKLTKNVMAQTMVQLLKIDQGKANLDAVGILEREGIVISSTRGYVAAEDFTRAVNGSISPGNGGGQVNGDNGNSPSPTRPGNGYGDKNHDHTGPPGQNKK